MRESKTKYCLEKLGFPLILILFKWELYRFLKYILIQAIYSMNKNLEDIRDMKKIEISSLKKKKKRYGSNINIVTCSHYFCQMLKAKKDPICTSSAELRRGPYDWHCNKRNIITTLSSPETLFAWWLYC